VDYGSLVAWCTAKIINTIVNRTVAELTILYISYYYISYYRFNSYSLERLIY